MCDGIVSYGATVRLRPISANLTTVERRSVGRIAKPLSPVKAAIELLYMHAIENMRAVLDVRPDALG